MHYLNLKFWAPFVAVVAFSLFAGLLVAEEAQFGVIKLCVGIAMVLFFFTSAKWWWVLIPAGFASGSVLYFGFKLYLHELCLILSCLPILFAVALDKKGMIEKRSNLPLTIKLLVLYLLIHMGWSLYAAKASGEGGFSNILRAYFGFMWGVGFVWLFHFVGKAHSVKIAFYLLYGTLAFRMIMTLVTYFFPSFNYVPVINLVLPGSAQSTDDLRISGPGVACCALCTMAFCRSGLMKSINFVMALFGVVALLMGGGRVAVVTFILFPLLLAWINRVWIWFVVFFALGLGLVSFLNISPRSIEILEPRIQRTLSVLVFDSSQSANVGTEGSDLWHSELRRIAIDRLLASPSTFLFGNRIKKFDWNAYVTTGNSDLNFQMALNQAADVGAYESAWFTILAIGGLFGASLTVWLVLSCIGMTYKVFGKTGVNSPSTAFCFLGFYQLICWVTFGWTVGGFPAIELVFSFIGLYASREALKQPSSATVMASSPSSTIFGTPKLVV